MDEMRDAEPGPVPHLALVTLADEPIALAVAKRLAALFPDSGLSHYSDLRQAAKDHPGARIVLAMTSPVEAVARRLASGAGALDALSDWVAEVSPHLAAARQHRRRLWLIDARAMAAGLPHALSAASSLADATGSGIAMPDPPEAMYLVLSDSLIARHEPAMRLAAEFTSLCRGPLGVTVDLAKVAEAHGNERAARAEATGLRAGQEAALAEVLADRDRQAAEIALLRESLLLQLTEAEAAAKTCAALKAEAATLGKAAAERHFFKSEAETLARRLEDVEESRLRRETILGAMLLADQAAVAELTSRAAELASRLSASELANEAMGRRVAELEAAQEAERVKAEALQAELQHVFASNSWKITGPLRRARNWIGPKAP